MSLYLPAASACFDIVLKYDGMEQLLFDIIAAVADLNKFTTGLSPELVCLICPSFPGKNPNHGAVWINCSNSPSFCTMHNE